MEERFKKIQSLEVAAELHSRKCLDLKFPTTDPKLVKSYLMYSFKTGGEYVLRFFEEELNWHTSPELGYFYDCLEEIIMKLKESSNESSSNI